jgi:hypothetical protein
VDDAAVADARALAHRDVGCEPAVADGQSWPTAAGDERAAVALRTPDSSAIVRAPATSASTASGAADGGGVHRGARRRGRGRLGRPPGRAAARDASPGSGWRGRGASVQRHDDGRRRWSRRGRRTWGWRRTSWPGSASRRPSPA